MESRPDVSESKSSDPDIRRAKAGNFMSKVIHSEVVFRVMDKLCGEYDYSESAERMFMHEETLRSAGVIGRRVHRDSDGKLRVHPKYVLRVQGSNFGVARVGYDLPGVDTAKIIDIVDRRNPHNIE